VQLAEAAAHLAQGAHVWATADVLTPAAWIRRECERAADREPGRWPRILGSTEEWLLWREAAQLAAHDLPVLDVGTLATSLQRASARAAAYGLTARAAPAGSEADLLTRAQRHFAARCRELDAACVSELMPRLSELPAQRVLLRGFDAIPPALAALTSAAATATTATAAAPATTALAAAVPPRPPVEPRGLRPVDPQAQMEAIAAWCCERLRADPGTRLLVMLPGPPGERERLAALIASVLDPAAVLAAHGAAHTLVGIEGGASFVALPLPAQALLGLSALSGEELDAQAVSHWLIAPFWGALPLAPRAALARLLRERASARISLRELIGALQLAPEELQAVARELDSRLRRAAALLGEGRFSARRWAERFEAALAALGWPGSLPPDSVLHRTRLRWRELLEEFGELAGSLGEVRREAALELLRALAQRAGFRAAEDDVPVTISPLLTDPVVIYDGVWVAGLSADVLPQPVTPDPFLPLHAQIAAGVPEASAVGRRAQARSLLAAWRAGARELVLSVPRREKDLELLPSPCLADLELREPETRPLWLPQRLHRDGCIERLEDRNGTQYNARTPLPGGVRPLMLQSACPFRAYAELRLGATEETRPEPGIAMDQRGILLHTSLELLWAQLRDSQSLAALEEHALLELIGECVRQAADSLPPWRRDRRRERRHARRAAGGQFDLFAVRSPALERECRRAERLIRRLCELERTRGPFTVEAIEHATELALGGGRVRLRIDRVDTVAGGRVLLDYKSGRPMSPDWLSERPTHPQLLAYASALGRDVVALATANLTAREVRFTGVAAAGGLLPKVKALPPGAAADWAAQLRSWEALIERLIGAFIAGDARVDPAPGACDHCHVTDVCRIGAHLSPEAATAVDEADE
jgi:ATP-dependent helicase/nuclease subunit B